MRYPKWMENPRLGRVTKRDQRDHLRARVFRLINPDVAYCLATRADKALVSRIISVVKGLTKASDVLDMERAYELSIIRSARQARADGRGSQPSPQPQVWS